MVGLVVGQRGRRRLALVGCLERRLAPVGAIEP
jgi:hypothetical protein